MLYDVDDGKKIVWILALRKRRYAMGDKGKKDKDKGLKQRISKQERKAKRKLEKQLRRTP